MNGCSGLVECAVFAVGFAAVAINAEGLQVPWVVGAAVGAGDDVVNLEPVSGPAVSALGFFVQVFQPDGVPAG